MISHFVSVQPTLLATWHIRRL